MPIEEYYAKEAPLEAHMSAPFQQRVLGEYMEKIRRLFTHNALVLDIGSGLGYNLNTLHKHFSNIVAADISLRALKHSKEEHARLKINYVVCDIQNMPFKDNSVDIVVCTETLEHVPDMQRAINECYRILKESGYIFISTPNYNNLIGLKKKLEDKKAKREYWEPWGGHIGGMERHMTPRKLHNALKKFKIIYTQGGGYLLPWTYFMPFFKRYHNKFPLLCLGKIPIVKYIGMHYFILAQKRG